MSFKDDNVSCKDHYKEIYFLKRYRSRIHFDIINENDVVIKDYLKKELDDLNNVIYNLCDHSFIGDEFEIGINKLQKVYYCIHCEMEMRKN